MKKVIFTLLALASAHTIFAQATYYWVGGATPTSFTANNNWNTQLGGGGSNRTANNGDVLIIDGTNIGGGNTGAITAPTGNITCGKLILQNGADLGLQRNVVGGSTTVTIGDATGSATGDELVVNSGCTLRLKGTQGNIVLVLNSNAVSGSTATTSSTALIQGHVLLEEGHNNSPNTANNRFTSRMKGAFVIAAGGSVSTTAAYGYYPFGTSSSGTTPANGGVVFESGSSFTYEGGWSPFGSNSQSFLTEFKPGSTINMRANFSGNGSMFNGRTLSDVVITNNATVEADGSIANIDNLTIDAGATFVGHTSGTTPVRGNIVNNDTLKAKDANPDRNNKLMLTGTANQILSGSGSYLLAELVVSNQSQGTLQTNISVDTLTNLIGTLNLNGFTITGPAPVYKPSASVNINADVLTDSINARNIADLTGVEPGMSVTGTNIAPNTVVVTTFSDGYLVLSNPATGNGNAALVVYNNQTVMPVTFKNIIATAKDEKVNINWTVGNEYNVAEYVIERSVNAREFAAIGTVKATGATAYNFTDANPLQSANYYRVKSVDKDGTSKYSTIVRVNMNGKGGFAIMENPVKGNTVKVNIANVEAGKYSISIVNSLGQTILSEQFNYTSGSLTKNINIPNVNKGIYNVVLRNANTVVTERVVVE